MRLALALVCAAMLATPAAAQPVQSRTVDLDGDGKVDTAEVVTGTIGCTLQITLAQEPDRVVPIATGQELCSTPFEILPPGKYQYRNLVALNANNNASFQDRPVTFRYPAIAGPRRPGVRSVTYWNGGALTSVWLVE